MYLVSFGLFTRGLSVFYCVIVFCCDCYCGWVLLVPVVWIFVRDVGVFVWGGLVFVWYGFCFGGLFWMIA